MNRERAKELLPIIEAYANGEEIEIYHLNTWSVVSEPTFAAAAKYRIKPKPLECWAIVGDYSKGPVFWSKKEAAEIAASRGAKLVRMVEQPEDEQSN